MLLTIAVIGLGEKFDMVRLGGNVLLVALIAWGLWARKRPAWIMSLFLAGTTLVVGLSRLSEGDLVPILQTFGGLMILTLLALPSSRDWLRR